MQEPSTVVTVSSNRILRSINLLYDADSPQNLDHFHPTQKTNKLVEAVLALKPERSFMVVAPYGSGKSLSAAVSLHIAENRDDSTYFLRQLLEKSESLSSSLNQFIEARLANRTRGMAIALHGYAPSFAASLQFASVQALSRLQLDQEAKKLSESRFTSLDDFPEFFERLSAICQRNGLDRVLILWDEFGRHLESLVAEGRAETLLDLQVLAEYCARSQSPTFSFTVLLHQVLSRYAHRLPQTARSEWAKIEGRFSTIQYVDTSKELYRLITEIVGSIHSGEPLSEEPAKEALLSTAKALQDEGLFSEFSLDELAQLFHRAHPIEPVPLYLLPRVSARVAQNERTMFTFLSEVDATRPITPESIYDYFSDLMQSDVSVGGTSRAWLEAQSAMQKCKADSLSIRAIKTACLLGLGLSGERAQASRNLLELGLAGYPSRGSDAGKTINLLIEKNLLLHRRHTDSISVWHGTDYDLRGRLDELMDLRGTAFDWVAFLREHVPPRAWRAVRYYSEFGVKRYFSATYASLGDLSTDPRLYGLEEDGKPLDGRIIHVLIQGSEEVAEAIERIKKHHRKAPRRILISVPMEKSHFSSAALEVACLHELRNDEHLTSQDPMVPAELDEMISDAESYLSKLLERATLPQVAGPSWYCAGKPEKIGSPRDLKDLLTNLLKAEFKATPKINNELIIKNRISKPIANARRKLMTGILNQTGDPMFGCPETEDRTPQASMCRTVLRNTGLYIEDKEGIFRFALSEELSNRELQQLWAKIGDFYSTEDANRKCFFDLVSKLSNVPYGMRAGVLPILLCAGYEGLCEEALIFDGGQFVSRIFSTTFEEICQRPRDFEIKVVHLNSSQRKYLGQLIHLFSSGAERLCDLDTRLLIRAQIEVEDWMSSLPIAALSFGSVSEDAKSVQRILRKLGNPEETFLRDIPEAFSRSVTLEGLPKRLASVISELTSLTTRFQSEVAEHVRSQLRMTSRRSAKEKNGLLGQVQAWASCFPETMQSNGSNLIGRRFLDMSSRTFPPCGISHISSSFSLVCAGIKRVCQSIFSSSISSSFSARDRKMGS